MGTTDEEKSTNPENNPKNNGENGRPAANAGGSAGKNGRQYIDLGMPSGGEIPFGQGDQAIGDQNSFYGQTMQQNNGWNQAQYGAKPDGQPGYGQTNAADGSWNEAQYGANRRYQEPQGAGSGPAGGTGGPQQPGTPGTPGLTGQPGSSRPPKKMNVRCFIAGMVTGALITALVGGTVGAFYIRKAVGSGSVQTGGSTSGGEDSGTDSSYDTVLNPESIAKIGQLEEIIRQYYYYDDEVTVDQEVDGLYKGLLESLDDPYSEYYTADETEQLSETTEGVYYGIGSYVSTDKDTGYPMLSGIFPDSPAEKAGLQDGDIITKVDGQDVSGMSLNDVVSMIRGDEGTDVVLTIYRDGVSDYQDITVTRGKVDDVTVTHSMKDEENKIGYIAITEFDDVTADQFKEAMADLEDQGMKGLVLDLRGNPGGNVSTVVDIANQLLPEGLVFYYEEADGSRTEYKADGTNEFTKPLVVLVNGYSASASEILSGAIQDSGIGTILGTQTYGKGVVQSVLSLGDGTSVKITTAAYFTRNGRDINHKGITPDEVLEFDSDAYAKDGTDNQLDRALEIIRDKE